jgi:hypothetical protein
MGVQEVESPLSGQLPDTPGGAPILGGVPPALERKELQVEAERP